MSNIQMGERIKNMREMREYTKETLAHKIGISPKFLSEIEKGKKNFSVNTLCRLSKELSVSCDYIVYGKVKGNIVVEEISSILETVDANQINKLQQIWKILYTMSNENKYVHGTSENLERLK